MTNLYRQEYNRASTTRPVRSVADTYEGKPCSTCFLPVKVIESIQYRPQHRDSSACWAHPGSARRSISACSWTCSRAARRDARTARGPFSLNLHRKLILALERQRFPEKTPNESDRWDWVHCEIYAGKSKTPFEIVAPDVAGEAVAGELEDQGTYRTIRALIGRCAGLVDPDRCRPARHRRQGAGTLRDAIGQLP